MDEGAAKMEFGYFTLSDNHYDNNERDANAFVADILDEAVYAENVGLHSAWIGEHHFSTLGVLSCPDLALWSVHSPDAERCPVRTLKEMNGPPKSRYHV